MQTKLIQKFSGAMLAFAIMATAAHAATMQTVVQGTVLNQNPGANGTLPGNGQVVVDRTNIFGFGADADLVGRNVSVTYTWSTDAGRGTLQAENQAPGQDLANWRGSSVSGAAAENPFESVMIDVDGHSVSFVRADTAQITFSDERRNRTAPNPTGSTWSVQSEGLTNDGTGFQVQTTSIADSLLPSSFDQPFLATIDSISDFIGFRLTKSGAAGYDFVIQASLNSAVVTQLGGDGTGGGGGTGASDVPLPAALPLFLASIGGLGAFARRKKAL